MFSLEETGDFSDQTEDDIAEILGDEDISDLTDNINVNRQSCDTTVNHAGRH